MDSYEREIEVISRALQNRTYKTDRRVGRVGVVEKMPRGEWMSSDQIAKLCGREQYGVGSHLTYAVAIGVLNKREHVCKCCGKTTLQWRRV